eukprot:m.67801 g.67801  ORF g.67801 m.67801 type:complete len:174 (-) comp14087_c0_seq2:922-1443(-)
MSQSSYRALFAITRRCQPRFSGRAVPFRHVATMATLRPTQTRLRTISKAGLLLWPFTRSYSNTTQASGESFIEAAITAERVVVFSATYCPYCTAVKDLLADNGIEFVLFELDREQPVFQDLTSPVDEVRGALRSEYKQRTIPAVFLDGKLIGGFTETNSSFNKGVFDHLLADQ